MPRACAACHESLQGPGEREQELAGERTSLVWLLRDACGVASVRAMRVARADATGKPAGGQQGAGNFGLPLGVCSSTAALLVQMEVHWVRPPG